MDWTFFAERVALRICIVCAWVYLIRNGEPYKANLDISVLLLIASAVLNVSNAVTDMKKEK